MSPEPTAPNPAQNTTPGSPAVPGRQTVAVPAPAGGASLTVASSPGGELVLGFDPAAATVSRSDNDLVFTLDGGGTVTVTGFFAVGDERLPNLRLPDGAVVASTDFFQGSDLDMTTAAGPAAAAAPPGGGTNYADDSGALLGGLIRLGSLGTDYWASATDPVIDMEGTPQVAGGTFTFGVFTGAGDGAGFVAGVYEDGRPGQYRDVEAPQTPGQIQMTFAPNPLNDPTAVTFDLGGDAGRGQFGTLDAQGDFQPAPDVDGVYTFTPAEVAAGAVYFMPAEDDDDTDISVTVSVTFVTNDGQTATVAIFGGIAVDAVADLPVDVNGDLAVGELLQSEMEGEGQGEATSVKLTVGAVFTDFADGSERQFLEVEGIPSDWTLRAPLPQGWTLVDEAGDAMDPANVVHGVRGTYGLRFEVTDDEALAVDGGGVVSDVLDFDPHDWTNKGGPTERGRWSDGTEHAEDYALNIRTRAVTEEANLAGDLETDLPNNVAESEWMPVDAITIVEDTPDFTTDSPKSLVNQNTDLIEDIPIIGNVGLGDAVSGGGGHGGGEFYFPDEQRVDLSISPANSLDRGLTAVIKEVVRTFEGTQSDASPLGIQHAHAGNTSETSAIEGGRGSIKFNLHSDGQSDPGQRVSQPSITWDKDNLLRAVVEGQDKPNFSASSLYAKPSGALAAEDYSYTDSDGEIHTVTQVVNNKGYAQLQFDVIPGGEDGEHSVMVGFFFDASGTRVVALVGVLSPNYETGTADITFAQYTPLWHPTEGMADNMQSYFQVKLTDDDGDTTYGLVQYRSLDDVATAGGNVEAVYDESLGNLISGNVLDKSVTDHDDTNDAPTPTHANSGSDGWHGGGSGDKGNALDATVTLSFAAPVDGTFTGTYSVLDATANAANAYTLTVGQEYTLMHDDKPVGIFVIDKDGDWTFTKATNNSGLNEDFRINVNYSVYDADGDSASAKLTIDVDALETLQLYITGDKLIYEEGALAESLEPVGTTDAEYTIHWTTGNVQSSDNGDLYSNRQFTFGVALEPKTSVGTGGLDYGDKYYDTVGESGDVRLYVIGTSKDADKDGVTTDRIYLDRVIPTDETAQKGIEDQFLEALNAQLAGDYPNGEVEATDIQWSAGWPRIIFTVRDGVELKPINLHTEATDDTIEDSGEKYTVSISSITMNNASDVGSVTAIRDPGSDATTTADDGPFKVTTEIRDAAYSYYNKGGLIGLEDTAVYESKGIGNGGQDPTCDVAVKICLYAQGGTFETGLTPPAENMTLTFKYTDNRKTYAESGDSAEALYDSDYVAYLTTGTATAIEWKAMGADGVTELVKYDGGHWVYKDLTSTDEGVYLPRESLSDEQLARLTNAMEGGGKWTNTATIRDLIVDDALTENDESFPIQLTDVKGNECAALPTDNPNSQAKITIRDDDTPYAEGQTAFGEDEHPLDGPRLIAFTSGWEKDGITQLYEPVATDKDGDSEAVAGSNNPFNEVTYTLSFDSKAEQDITITLKVEDIGGTNGDDGKDYSLYFGGEPITPDENGEFTVTLIKGSCQADFTVRVQHDHDATSKQGGLDGNKEGEGLKFTVTNMENGEVQWSDVPASIYDESVLTNEGVFVDDMKGPKLSFGSLEEGESGSTLLFTLARDPGVELGETVDTVFITFEGKDNTITVECDLTTLNRDGAGNYILSIPSGIQYDAYYRVYLSDHDKGGETRINRSISEPFYNIGEGGTSNYLTVSVDTTHNIQEGGENSVSQTAMPKSVSYIVTIDGINVTNIAEGVGFTIKVHDVDTTAGDPGDFAGVRDVDLFLNGEFLNQWVGWEDPGIKLSIFPDGDGNIHSVTISDIDGNVQHMTYYPDEGYLCLRNGNGTSTRVGKINGKLPTANDDSYIENPETFQPIIVDNKIHGGSQWVLPEAKVPQEVTIRDNDVPKVNLSFDSRTGEEGGADHTLTVSLTDEGGNQLSIPLGGDPIVVKIDVSDPEGAEGRLLTHVETVVFHPGQECKVDVGMSLPNNYLDQGESAHTVTATATIQGKETQAIESFTVTETPDGPYLSLVSNSPAQVSENSSVEYIARLEMAASQDVTVTMQISFAPMDKADTATAFTPDDVKSLTVGGKEYSFEGADFSGDTVTLTNGSDTLKLIKIPDTEANDSANNWTFTVDIPEGEAAARVTLNLNDDKIKEESEAIRMSVLDAEGSEVRLASDVTEDRTLTDHREGPKLSLTTADTKVEEGGEAAFTLTLGSNAVPVDAEITLQLNAGWENLVAQNADGTYMVDVRLGSDLFRSVTVDTENGTFKIDLPENTPAGTKVAITVPLADNQQDNADRTLGLSIADTGTQGEITVAGAPDVIGSLFSLDSASATYECKATDAANGTATADATVSYTLTGLTKANIDAGAGISVNGTKVTAEDIKYTTATDNGTVVITVDHKQGAPLTDVIKVSSGYSDVNRGLSITGSVTLGAVTVTVTDEAAASLDGPSFSVEAAAIAGAFTSGQEVSFTIANVIQAETVEAADHQTTTEPIYLTFILKDVDSGSVKASAFGEESITHNGDGSYTLTIPEHTPMGDLDSFTLSASTNVPAGDVAGPITLKITDVSGNEAGYVKEDSTGTVTDSVKITLDDDEGDFNGSASNHGLEIVAGGVGSIITGSAYDDVIHGGAGNDTLTGGAGNDTFVWSVGDFGGQDTITDFTFNSDSSTPGDRLVFTGLFSEMESVDALLHSSENDSLFRYEEGSSSLELQFLSEHELRLTLKSEGEEQQITVRTAQDSQFYTDQTPDETTAAAILQQLIKGASGTE